MSCVQAFIPAASFHGSFVRPRTIGAVHNKPVRRAAKSHTTRCMLTVDRLVNKSYQLEEDEDALSCTSAIYLSEDGTMSIGKTDGPKPERVDAKWKYSDSDGELLLEIERFFEEGRTSFSVKRVLRGHLDDTRKNLADLPVFAGAMYQHPADFSPNSEIGWFAMIRATDDLPREDFDISVQ